MVKSARRFTIAGPEGIIFKGSVGEDPAVPKISWKKWPSAQLDKMDTVINTAKTLQGVKNQMR